MVVRQVRPRLADFARYERWVHASHGLDHIFPALAPIIQGIGRLDAELCAEDEDHYKRRAAAKLTKAGLSRFDQADPMRLTD